VLQAARSRVRIPIISLEVFTGNISGRSVALGSTQPLTEEGWWVKGGRCIDLTALPPSCSDCHEIGYLSLLEPSICPACNGIALLLLWGTLGCAVNKGDVRQHRHAVQTAPLLGVKVYQLLECCVLSGSGLCGRPILRPEESYRVCMCVCVCHSV